MTSPKHPSSLWQLMAEEARDYTVAVLTMALASAFLYLAPFVPQVALDGVLVEQDKAANHVVRATVEWLGGRTYLSEHLWILALLLAALTGLSGALSFLRNKIATRASEGIIRRLRNRVYDHIQRLPASYFDKVETGDLIQRCTSDIENVRVFLTTQVIEIARGLIMLIVPLPLMWSTDPRLTVAATCFIPVIVGYSAVFFLRIRWAFHAQDESEATMTATVQENLTAIRVVRAFARQSHASQQFAADSDDYRRHALRLFRLLALFWSSSDLLTFVQRGTVLATGIYLLSQGDLAVGAFFFFLTVTAMFIAPLRMMGRILTELGQATVAFGRIRAVLKVAEESQPISPIELNIKPRGHVVVENLQFSHGPRRILQAIDLDVPPGRSLGLVGASGSGKSTLIELLTRIYDPEAGRILLDGIDMQDIDRRALRSRISVVRQEPFLYAKSILENIRMGRRDATEAEVHRAARVACIHDSIIEFEQGYATKIGERGVTLSGGQRQRIALARALLARPTLLVLDDALSAVDRHTEANILEALADQRARQSTIVSAHRLSCLQGLDEIAVLDRGRVVELGSHRQLLARAGKYAGLWARQTQTEPPRLAYHHGS